MASDNSSPILDILRQKDFVLVLGGVGLLLIMIAPLPTIIMDVLLATSFGMALLVMLVTFYVKKPVDFSVFPTVLLGTTLYRLSLNVATTRIILLEGAQMNGTQADFHQAGYIIGTFGKLVVGGNVVVGLVVFIILVTINFVVITKGAGRVAEVAARFTLDALPGKQMSIDAELNQGLIDEKTAKRRRSAISKEADFYGNMDGASKFIRGDAIAGILITLVNIIGGILIGIVQMDMSFDTALRTFTVLTIGDGLVGQIPALVVSGSAGLLVTRVPEGEGDDQAPFHEELADQLLGSVRTISYLAIALLIFAMIPGLTGPFVFLALIAVVLAYYQNKREKDVFAKKLSAEQNELEVEASKEREISMDNLLAVEPLALELGVDLVPLVDERRGGNMIRAIQKIRTQLAEDLGLMVPLIHVRDNLNINGGLYRIMLRGEVIGQAEVFPRQVLAINPGDARAPLRGIKTVEPSFGLDAWWIPESQRMRAQAIGYTVVDVGVVISTHLTETLKRHADEIFSRDQLEEYVDRLKQQSPQLVDDLIPSMLTRQQVFRVIRNLLKEGLSIRDSSTIFEYLADYAGKFKDPDTLTEFVRQGMRRQISRRYISDEGNLVCIGFSPDVEDALTRGLQTGDGGSINLTLNPDIQQRVLLGIRSAVEQCRSPDAVVLCPHFTRGPLKRLADRFMARPPAFLSPKELENDVSIKRIATVSLKGVKLVS